VVEGHRNADPVLLRIVAELPDEEAVVEDVAVAECCALGKPVVPEVYWMLMGSLFSRLAWTSESCSAVTRAASSTSACQLSVPMRTTCSSPATAPRTSSIIAA